MKTITWKITNKQILIWRAMFIVFGLVKVIQDNNDINLFQYLIFVALIPSIFVFLFGENISDEGKNEDRNNT